MVEEHDSQVLLEDDNTDVSFLMVSNLLELNISFVSC